MSTTFGTAHFVSRAAAIRYYRTQGYCDATAAVDDKLAGGEIHIGPPKSKGRVWINQEEGRYMVTEDTAE